MTEKVIKIFSGVAILLILVFIGIDAYQNNPLIANEYLQVFVFGVLFFFILLFTAKQLNWV